MNKPTIKEETIWKAEQLLLHRAKINAFIRNVDRQGKINLDSKTLGDSTLELVGINPTTGPLFREIIITLKEAHEKCNFELNELGVITEENEK